MSQLRAEISQLQFQCGLEVQKYPFLCSKLANIRTKSWLTLGPSCGRRSARRRFPPGTPGASPCS